MPSLAHRILSAMWEETVYPKNTLGLSREDMPQIRTVYIPEFLDYLRTFGIVAREETVPASDLKPTQKEINGDKARSFNPEMHPNAKMLVSRDGYIMDGHHRWLHGVMNKLPLKIVRLSTDIRTLLKLAAGFGKTVHSGLNDYHQKVA